MRFALLFAVFVLFSSAVDIAIDVSDDLGSLSFTPSGGASGVPAQVGDRLVFTFKKTTHNLIVFRGTPPLSCTYPSLIRYCSWGDHSTCAQSSAGMTEAAGAIHSYTITQADIGQKLGFLCWPHCPSMAGFVSVGGVAQTCENTASTCTPSPACTTCACYTQWSRCLKDLGCADSSTQYKSFLAACRAGNIGCDDSYCPSTSSNEPVIPGSGSLMIYSGSSCGGSGTTAAFSTCSQDWPSGGPWSAWTGNGNTRTYYRYDCAKSRLSLAQLTAPTCATAGLSYTFSDNTNTVCHSILEGQLSVKVSCYAMCSGYSAPANAALGNCPSTSVNSGSTCTPVCASGYTGALQALCDAGTWKTTGACTVIPDVNGDGTGKDVVDWIDDQFNDGKLLYVISKTDHWPVNDQRYTYIRTPPASVYIRISGGCNEEFSEEVCAADLAEALADWVNIDVDRFTWTVTSNNKKRANQQLTVNYRVADGNNPDSFGSASGLGVALSVQLVLSIVLLLW